MTMKKSTPKKRQDKHEPLLHKSVQYRLAVFLQRHPPREFNRELRNLFIDYLIHREGVDLRINKKALIEGFWDLLQVLDEAETHWHPRDVDDIIREYRR
jgi:hypothetical protein